LVLLEVELQQLIQAPVQVLLADPREQVSLAAEFPEICLRLKNRFQEVIRNFGGTTDDYALGNFSAEEEEKIKERLKSLGYIE